MEIIKRLQKNFWETLPSLGANELEEAIRLASEYYYNRGKTLLTDNEFDALLERLRAIKSKSPVLREVGSQTRKRVRLPFSLGSLNKIKTDEQLLQRWRRAHGDRYVVSDKLDGVSCLLVVRGGRTTLYTRGDGYSGQNITHLSRYLKLSAEGLKTLDHLLAVRGELVISRADFSQKYAQKFSNMRNMVAGLVNSRPDNLDPKTLADVHFVVYEIIEPEGLKPSEQLSMLGKWGMEVVYWDVIHYFSLVILDALLQKRRRRSVYDIDGIVITADRVYTRPEGENPDYAFAYKGISDQANVKVLAVEWHASKDGVLVPTIVYERAKVSQAELTRATGFNARFIVEHKIGPGAIITIIRSGDTIPYVLHVVRPAKKPDLPDLAYHWDENHVNIILDQENQEVLIQRIVRFMKTVGAEGISEATVQKLVAAGYQSVPEILRLTPKDLAKLEGIGNRLAEKLHQSLRRALGDLDLSTLMVASNLFGRGFGDKRIRKILQKYPQIVEKYEPAARDDWERRLLAIPGFNEKTIGQFLDALPGFQQFYQEVQQAAPWIRIRTPNRRGSFSGQIIVFTGFRDRNWQRIIEREGGQVAEYVGKETTLLVYNDGDTSSIKYRRAVQLGVPRMPRSQFTKKIEKYNLQ
jgi:DNA ligase (NAD+)